MWQGGLLAGKSLVSNHKYFRWCYPLSREESSSFRPGSVGTAASAGGRGSGRFIAVYVHLLTDPYFHCSAPLSSLWACSTPPKAPITLTERESPNCAGSRKVRGGEVPLPYSDFPLTLLLSAPQLITIF